MTDESRIAELKAELEAEINAVKDDIKNLNRLIIIYEVENEGFATNLRKQRSQQQEHLTRCRILHDACWPTTQGVLDLLEHFYREMPLH